MNKQNNDMPKFAKVNDKISLNFKYFKLFFIHLKLRILLSLSIKSKRERMYNGLKTHLLFTNTFNQTKNINNINITSHK